MALTRLLLILFIFQSELNFVDGSKLMVLLIDGFRWDYFNLPGLKLRGFPRIMKGGVKAEYIVPDFPTNSYPNYYSIMTGLHTDTHGIVGNYIYDYEHNETFEMAENPETLQSYWWNDGEPLWRTAEKQGKHAYMYFWRECNVKIRGGYPTFCRPYDVMPTMDQVRWAIYDGIQQLQDSKAEFVGVYHQHVDKNGHSYGPNSAEVKQAVLEIDTEIDLLLDYIEANKLQDTINFIVVSDHGMTSVDELHVINITHALNMDDITAVVEAGTQVYVWPKEGKDLKVYQALLGHGSKHLKVFYREELKNHWIFKKHRRIPPIFVTTDPGWYIAHSESGHIYAEAENRRWLGNHGYDNQFEDMWAIFLATGPDFKTGYKAPPFKNIEIYNIMCEILQVKPAPNNGTLHNVSDMLVKRDRQDDVHGEL